jgi:hypothetical protein
MTSARLLAEWSHDPGCSCSKTSLGCCLLMAGTLWPVSFRGWPRSATSSRTGLYELPTLEPLTAASGGSASPGLLKTPTAQLAVNGGSQPPEKRKAGGHGPTLADQVEHELLPTPTAREKGGRNARHGDTSRGDDLPEAVRYLPTPNATDHKGAGQQPRRIRDGRARPASDADLPTAVQLLPTPRATDGTKGGPNQRGSSGDLMLPSAVMGLLPTPTAADGDRTSRTYPRGDATLIGALLPTPSVADATGGHKTRSGDRNGEPLLGGIAMLLSNGDLTDPPLPDGSES